MRFLSDTRYANASSENTMDNMRSFESEIACLRVSGLILMVEPSMDSVGATVPVIVGGVTAGMRRRGVGGRRRVARRRAFDVLAGPVVW